MVEQQWTPPFLGPELSPNWQVLNLERLFCVRFLDQIMTIME